MTAKQLPGLQTPDGGIYITLTDGGGNLVSINSGGGGRTVLTSDVTYYVNFSTGSDANTGTSGSPFKTIQHAANVAASFDYNGLYSPTISVVDGASTGVAVALPYIPNVNPNSPAKIIGNTTTPSNCILTGAGAGSQIFINDIPGCIWRIGGFEYDMNGATGIYAQNFTATYIFASNFIGSGGTGVALKAERYGYIDGANYPLSTSPPNPGIGFYGDPIAFQFGGSMDELVFCLGLSNVNLDGAPINFLSSCSTAITFDIEGESRLGLYYTQFSNTGNLTASGLTAYLWDKSTVDSIPLNRSQLPGFTSTSYVQDQFQNSLLTGDLNNGPYQYFAPSTGNTIVIPPGTRQVIVDPAGTLAALTITLPSFPGDGDSVSIGTSQTITTLTLNTSDGSTVSTYPTSLVGGTSLSLTNAQINVYPLGVWYISGGNHG